MSEAKANFDLNSAEERLEKRILVLGSAPHTRQISSYAWDRLPESLNVADYDVVILNLEPFLDQNFADNINIERFPSWQHFAKLVFSQGSELIIIGQPTIYIGKNPRINISMWLPPLLPELVVDSGEEIRNIDPEFTYYFKYVRRWFFHRTSNYIPNEYIWTHYLNLVHPQADDLGIRYHSLAQTRFQEDIAFRMKFQALGVAGGNFIDSQKPLAVLRISGDVICLPIPTEISAQEAVDLILQERYKLQFESTPPAWIEAYKLPHELPIEAEIDRCKDAIKQLEKELTAATIRLGEESRFRKLLYEQGEAALEPVVRDVLRELDAQVDEPKQPGKEDGRLIDLKQRRGMLEIKGLTHQLKLREVRQLDQWVRDALIDEDWESKGILIVNAFRNEPLGNRGEPFPLNCIQAAKKSEQCLITTIQLYNALCALQRGELNLEIFWDTIFSTSGVFSLPGLDLLCTNS
ncbi:hypothetical protein [Nostoc sp.]|uniref:hypothetical protein n=1 Tax=Nostoc sp. TaxID=1180 RepID=UPI002FF53E91